MLCRCASALFIAVAEDRFLRAGEGRAGAGVGERDAGERVFEAIGGAVAVGVCRHRVGADESFEAIDEGVAVGVHVGVGVAHHGVAAWWPRGGVAERLEGRELVFQEEGAVVFGRVALAVEAGGGGWDAGRFGRAALEHVALPAEEVVARRH